MPEKTRSKSVVIQRYFDKDHPLKLFSRQSVSLLIIAILLIVIGSASLIFVGENANVPLTAVLIGFGACLGLFGTLKIISAIADQWNAIKFIRERIFVRFEQFPKDYQGPSVGLDVDNLGEVYRFSGFSVLNANCSGKAQISYPDKKNLYSDVFEVNVIALQGEQLAIYTRRTQLSSADYSVDTLELIPRNSITGIAVREVVLDSPNGKKKQTGLFRYLELTTKNGAKHSASLSHFDPLDERLEPNFDQEVAALKKNLSIDVNLLD